MSSLKSRTIKSAVAVAAIGYLTYKLTVSRINNNAVEKYIVIENVEDWDIHEAEIIKTFSTNKVIGLDCEWVTLEGNRNPISLLQLGNEFNFCVLIRLSCIPEWLIPPGIADLLANENILKVGVGIHEDVSKLFQDYSLEVRGYLDLRYIAKDLKEIQGKNLSLKSLGSELLGVDINKSKSVRCSNWDAPSLSMEQIKYAADDAIIAAKLFSKIQRRKTQWFLGLFSSFTKDVRNYSNLPYKSVMQHNTNNKNTEVHFVKSLKSRYSKPRQKPMYDNCQLVAPDGELLCSCDKGKADWYIYKGLGEKISDHPYTVRLNFEPSGRPTLDNVFYTKEKFNQCVVCGKAENFHRKLVVPSEYRKYFPNLMKKNLSHDVLLLCVLCHKKSNILDQEMRQKLAELCDAPLGCKTNVRFKINPKISRVRSAANALINSGDKIPEARQNELKQEIMDYFKVSEVTEDILKEAVNQEANLLNETFVSHGLKVYEYFCKHGGLIEFEKMWRQHFLDTMQPKFLPAMWSVEHNHKRLALQVVNHERDVDFDESILGLSNELVEEIKQLH